MKRIGLVLLGGISAFAGAQVSGGQIDTFSSNIANWQGASPTWVSTGGPGGAGDGFLQLTSSGTGGPGSRMAGFNNAQWSGNYIAAGVGSIAVDFRNLGNTNLEMRLVFFDTALTTQWVSNASVVINAGSLWQHFTFAIDPGQFTQTEGSTSFASTLSAANRMMFRHDPGTPSNGGVVMAGTLGIDNIKANPVPEPTSIAVLGVGAMLLRRRIKPLG